MPEIIPAERKMQTFRQLVGENYKALNAVLPRTITPERMAKAALDACVHTPRLLDCTKESFLGAMLTAAALGLEPVGGLCWFVPYGDRVVLIPGYKGYIQLAYRSLHVKNVFAAVVYAKDTFSYRRYPPQLEHVPHRGPDRGDKRAAYAVASVNGVDQWEVMEDHEIVAIKRRSASATKKESPWNHPDDEAEMWKKTALKRLCKVLPWAVEDMRLQLAVDLDERAETGQPQLFLDAAQAVAIQPATPATEELKKSKGPSKPKSDDAAPAEDGAPPEPESAQARPKAHPAPAALTDDERAALYVAQVGKASTDGELRAFVEGAQAKIVAMSAGPQKRVLEAIEAREKELQAS